MYVKRLDLKGFKSFADSTEIIFKPGINIIVGPNGCGKSNVVDAIRWTLGESNVRHLRGQKNEDVIFNGSDKKKALGMATVNLTIDNSEHSLPLEYNEITIGRKIFRSGESEFYLNKSKVRLKDIVNLFTGTGLGRKGFSIISQGELEQVLNGHAFDRRLILEEASGIIKYRQQRDEVKRRISATENDILRLGDILKELDLRKGELGIKAEKAQKYLKINEELNKLQRLILEIEIKETVNKLDNKKQDFSKHQNELKIILSDFDLKVNELEELEKSLEEIRQLISRRKEEKYQLETENNKMYSEQRLSNEKINNCCERIDSILNNELKYKNMLEKLEGDIKLSREDYDREKLKFSEISEKVTFLKNEIDELENNLEDKKHLFEKQKGFIFSNIREEADKKKEIIDKEDGIRKSIEKKERLKIHIEESFKRIKSIEEQMLFIAEEKKSLEKDLKDIELELEKIEEQKKNLLVEREKYKQDCQNLDKGIIKIQNNLIAINDQEKRKIGYSEGVKNLIQALEKGEKKLRGIKGMVSDLITVPTGMELAIDTALGRGLENIVVQNGKDAEDAIEYIKKQRMGRLTFLPLDLLRTQELSSKVKEDLAKKEGVLGIASELVSFDSTYKKAIDYLLGRVLIVQDLDKGMKVFKNSRYSVRIVSLEGDLINVSGAMTGGVQSKKVSPLQRKGEERRLKEQLEKQRKVRLDKQAVFDQKSGNLQLLEDKLLEMNKRKSELNFKYKMACDELESLNKNLNIEKSEYNNKVQEIEQHEKSIKIFETALLKLQKDYDKVQKRNVLLNDEIEQMKQAIEVDIREYEVKKERCTSQLDQMLMKEKELQNNIKNIEQFEKVQNSYQQSLEESIGQRERLQKEMKTRQNEVQNIGVELKTKEEELEKIKSDIKIQVNAEKSKVELIKKMRTANIPLKQDISTLENRIRTMEMQVIKIETELDVLKNKWSDNFEGEPQVESILNISSQEIRQYKSRSQELVDYLEQIGPVDIEAIREHTELEERYEFINKQYLDLSSARGALLKLLLETEKLMDKNFTQFLLLANESFKNTFTEIFGGGEAALQLEVDEDILSSGVDIVVKMPGKRKQSLNLLSGGERALTCIAFIFALLRLKPVPFCLLDEIDAALDETNLMRFTSFLKNMADQIQFLVITHRQASIESGNNIYGVTMPQQGVSAVLSLEFNEAESLAV